ncbi:MAG: OmpH family outer membrane protein [Gammaproteobacteria bacterium]|nr:OmpH family outer membrane protein [Gammaproteobacteria bacterium]
MMSRVFRTSVVCLIVVFSFSAFAQLKIAAVNVSLAIFNTDEGKAIQEQWIEEYKPEIDRVASLQEEIADLSEKYRTDVDILTELERATLELEIESKNTILQNLRQQIDTGRATKAELYIREKAPLFQTVLNDLIAIEGYDAVFRLDIQEQSFLHLNQKHIITAKITEMINESLEEKDELPDELTDEPTEDEESAESSEGGE